jgi:hypothetical protein
MSKSKLIWRDTPESQDYEAAASYVSLILRLSRVKALIGRLRAARVTQRSAKDLLRASSLPLLSRDDSSVQEDLKKIAKGKALSPVLLIRGDLTAAIPLTVADGYHRICAVCYFDEGAPVACKLVEP